MDMKEKLQELAEAARKRIEESDGPEKLNEVKVAYLGKKGELTAILKSMKDVAPEDRPKVGQMVNETRTKIEEHLEATRKKLEEALREEKMKAEVIDVTLPAKKAKIGHRHPNSIALEEVERIFIGMGYEVVEGPEVEYADYNFTKLNIPEDHPARDEQDTFFINDSILLRSQTSPVQARTMEEGKLPIRMIAPGRVFRSDEVDATHSPSFHQIEGLVVDKNITFADLKGTLEEFAKELACLPKICPHFHLSLQSGCDETLKRMNRHYTAEEYYEKVQILRKYFEHPAITTDVIVGFPGETAEEFAVTKTFLEKVHFFEMHIFKYSRRKGTVADKLPGQLTDAQKTERSGQLLALEKEQSREFRAHYLGQEVEVLIEEQKEIGGKVYWLGHTDTYVKAAFAADSAECMDYSNRLVHGRAVSFLSDEVLEIALNF